MGAKRGRLIIISAPSGAGKTSIVDGLLARNKDLIRSVSYTTRSARPNEVNGRDYFFIPREEFLTKQKNHFFLESADVFGQFYGTSKEFVLGQIDAGKSVVLAIDVQGMKQLKQFGSDVPTISIFIMPPSADELKMRLENRKTDSQDEINKRLKTAEEEIKAKSLYDFIVVNHKLEDAVASIEGLIR